MWLRTAAGILCLCWPLQSLGTPHIANLQIFHNEPAGVNVTWDYVEDMSSSAGQGTASLPAKDPARFTVQFYELLLDPCCGPFNVTHCVNIIQRWCQVDDIGSSNGYHFQVLSMQEAYRSNVSSVGFFQNGVNGRLYD